MVAWDCDCEFEFTATLPGSALPVFCCRSAPTACSFVCAGAASCCRQHLCHEAQHTRHCARGTLPPDSGPAQPYLLPGVPAHAGGGGLVCGLSDRRCAVQLRQRWGLHHTAPLRSPDLSLNLPPQQDPRQSICLAAVQHRGGQAPVLQHLRHLPLLPAAQQSCRLRR